jgi:hypothetical protein
VSAAADLTLDALAAIGVQLSGYAAALRAACQASPPPFEMGWYGHKFRTLACDPAWLAACLVQNAQVEGDGSRKLWNLAGRAASPRIAGLVRQHAIDESRHARLYLIMTDLSFPRALAEDLKEAAAQFSPRLGRGDHPPMLPPDPDEVVLDELIQMNIGEIRTRIHQLLLRPMLLAHTKESKRPSLQRVLDSLLRDETKHIAYTAQLIEEHVQDGADSFVRWTFEQRVRDFNQLTLTEVGGQRFTGE